MNNKKTRFRAYYMQHGGVSMSYVVDSSFALIEGRYNDDNREKIKEEMELTGMDTIELLHISSWAPDFCNPEELPKLLEDLQPFDVEIPAYIPDTNEGKECRKIIKDYCNNSIYAELFESGPKTLLYPANLEEIDYIDVILSPLSISNNNINNAVVKLFKRGRFSVLNASTMSTDNGIVKSLEDANLLDCIDVLVARDVESSNSLLVNHIIAKTTPSVIFDTINKYVYITNHSDLSCGLFSTSILVNHDLLVRMSAVVAPFRNNESQDVLLVDKSYTRRIL